MKMEHREICKTTERILQKVVLSESDRAFLEMTADYLRKTIDGDRIKSTGLGALLGGAIATVALGPFAILPAALAAVAGGSFGKWAHEEGTNYERELLCRMVARLNSG
jgi:uncharacterized membrane-anchored protein